MFTLFQTRIKRLNSCDCYRWSYVSNESSGLFRHFTNATVISDLTHLFFSVQSWTQFSVQYKQIIWTKKSSGWVSVHDFNFFFNPWYVHMCYSKIIAWYFTVFINVILKQFSRCLCFTTIQWCRGDCRPIVTTSYTRSPEWLLLDNIFLKGKPNDINEGLTKGLAHKASCSLCENCIPIFVSPF